MSEDPIVRAKVGPGRADPVLVPVLLVPLELLNEVRLDAAAVADDLHQIGGQSGYRSPGGVSANKTRWSAVRLLHWSPRVHDGRAIIGLPELFGGILLDCIR